jgi:hypothetical protein
MIEFTVSTILNTTLLYSLLSIINNQPVMSASNSNGLGASGANAKGYNDGCDNTSEDDADDDNNKDDDSDVVVIETESSKTKAYEDTKAAITEDLQKKIGNYSLVVKSNRTKRKQSAIWEKFQCILRSDNQRIVPYVVCTGCNNVYSYTRTSGTSTLAKHKCANPQSTEPGRPKIHSFMKRSATNEEKKVIALSAVKLCAIDLTPFNIVAGNGFKDFVQCCMDASARSHGRLMVDDLLPNPTTVSRNVATVEGDIVKRLKQEFYMQSIIESVGLSFTTDMYTEDYTKVSYSVMTCHWINNLFELHHSTLGCKTFPEDERHTTHNIKLETVKILAEYGLNDLPHDETVLVTDDGPGNTGQQGIETLFTRICCADHKLGTIITTVLNKTTSQTDGHTSKPFYRYQDDLPTILLMIDGCKSLVQYFNQANLQHKLPKTLKKENATRWSSLYEMLYSIHDVYGEACDIIKLKHKESKMADIPKALLHELLLFLDHFKIATKRLECAMTPTMHLVVLTYVDLVRECEAPSVHPEIGKLKRILQAILIDKFQLNKFHVAAAFLDPRQTLRLHKYNIDAFVLQQGKLLIEQQYNAVKRRDNFFSNTAGSRDTTGIGCALPRAKKARTTKSLFAFLDEDADGEGHNYIQTEIDRFKMI